MRKGRKCPWTIIDEKMSTFSDCLWLTVKAEKVNIYWVFVDKLYLPWPWFCFFFILPSSAPVPAKLGWVSLIFHSYSRPAAQPATRTSSELSKTCFCHSPYATQLDEIWKRTSIFLKMEDNLNFFKWKTTSIFRMEDNINLVLGNLGMQHWKWKMTTILFKWKTASAFWKWKTTSIIWKREDNINLLKMGDNLILFKNGRQHHFC